MAGRPKAEWSLMTLQELKDWLRERGADSMAEGARMLGVTPQTLTKWIKKEGAPSEVNQRKLLARMNKTERIPNPTVFETSPQEIARKLNEMALKNVQGEDVNDPATLMLAANLILEREEG